jgi:hypothetical protein
MKTMLGFADVSAARPAVATAVSRPNTVSNTMLVVLTVMTFLTWR